MTPEDQFDETGEVVKWYTRARRFPQLIGKTPDGASIWGGPYTYTQVGVGVGLLFLGSKTIWLWGRFDLLTNALLLLGLTYGAVLLVGRLPVGSRNPLSILTGVIRALTAPCYGTLNGAPFRPTPPHVARSRLVISQEPPPAAEAVNQPASHEALTPAPAPAPSPPVPSHYRPAPALTGVQRLLAAAGATTQEN